LSAAGTVQGVILGTAAYMSPEQARGKEVNKATDLWAFGCVLYELLCGHSAFEGEDVTEILAAVVKTDPDWDRLPEATPAAIRVLLRRCLRKERRQRLQDATDLRIEIEDALAAPSLALTATVPSKRGWRQGIVSGLAVLLAALLDGIAVWNLWPNPRLRCPQGSPGQGRIQRKAAPEPSAQLRSRRMATSDSPTGGPRWGRSWRDRPR
jgi:serine/threonine protein kinase